MTDNLNLVAQVVMLVAGESYRCLGGGSSGKYLR